MKFKAEIIVRLKKHVLDPQGDSVESALSGLGLKGTNVRQGKVFDMELEAGTRKQAEKTLKSMCDKLLVNSVLENCDFKIKER